MDSQDLDRIANTNKIRKDYNFKLRKFSIDE